MMQRVHRRRPAGTRRAAVTLSLLFLACALLAAVLPQAAGAAAMGFSFTPSKTEPYAVCGHATPGHAACLAILVPSARRSLSAEPQAASPAPRSPSFTGSGVGGGYSPTDLRSAYDLPSEFAGSGQTVAIVDAFDDPDAESDLGIYRSRYGISACTTANGCFKKVNQNGAGSYPAANEGWAVEISLDLDMVSAACPNCHILLVEATNNENANLFKAEDEAAALGATEISNSWGGLESSGDASEDTYFHHAGVPVTASAGDSGYEVEYPAASQYVIAVGGTALTQASNSRGWSETAWAGTGSGCSAYEAKPAWQSDAGCSHRTNNDVAAVASPETPVSFADSYKLPAEFSQPEPGWSLVGGTSVSSPLIAGTMALANAYTRSLPGAEALYTEAAQNGTGTLDDVTSGSNGSCGTTYLCNAVSGYDGPTGLGSPYGAPVALPSAPAVVTTAASSLTQTTATLAATVNPNGGEVTECKLEYGTTTSYGSSAPCSSLPGSGSSPVAVSASASGLTANTTYHFRISATNAGGTSKGADEAFKTLPNAPTAVTDPASSLTQTTATLAATVNPNGGEVTGCELEYGTTTAYGSSAPCSSLPGSGSSPVAVSASLTGLSANTTYHFRISATNAGGTNKGSDETLKTLPDAPAIVTGAASSITQTAVTLNATVNPSGGAVSKCEFEYGTTTTYGSSATCTPSPGSGSGPVAVSVSVSGLTANTTYHFRISATNAGGTSKGSDEAFKTVTAPMPAPTVETKAASSITQTSAALNATVNPNGGAVNMCEFEYGTTTSYGSSVPCSLPQGESGAVAVVVSIEGLAAATTYYFRIVAANQGGTSAGVEQTLTTLLPATLPQQGSGVQEVLSAPVVPPSLQPQQQTAPAPPVPDAKLAATSLEVSLSGKVAIGVSCPAEESSCTGTIVLRTLTAVSSGVTGHESKKTKAAILTLADASFTVAGGKVRALTLRLSARARALLVRTHALRVRATIVAHDPDGGAHTTQTLVTLRMRKATRN